MNSNTQIKTKTKTAKRRTAEAAVWLTRVRRGEDMTRYESLKFTRWFAERQNRVALAEVDDSWEALGNGIERARENGELDATLTKTQKKLVNALK